MLAGALAGSLWLFSLFLGFAVHAVLAEPSSSAYEDFTTAFWFYLAVMVPFGFLFGALVGVLAIIGTAAVRAVGLTVTPLINGLAGALAALVVAALWAAERKDFSGFWVIAGTGAAVFAAVGIVAARRASRPRPPR